METIRFSLNNLPEKKDNLTLALGTFDGFHKAHYKLALNARFETTSYSGILFFSASPENYLARNKSKNVLTSLDDKIRYASKVGLDYAYVIDVDSSFFSLTPIEFINKILLPLGVTSVVVGEDFRFGKNGAGDVDLLRKYFKVYCLKIEKLDGVKISSSNIKEYIEEGEVKKAWKFLGHPYEISGYVIKGFHNGHKIGFPTLNISLKDNYVLPLNGVYFGLCYCLGIPYKALINVGNNPTIGKLNKPLVEVHLLDFNKDLYNDFVYVSFLEFERKEIKFNSLEELKKQIENDKKWALSLDPFN